MSHADDLLKLSQAGEVVPGGASRHRVWRWIRCGVAGRKLPAQRVGGLLYVRREDLDDFLAAVASPTDPTE